MAQVRRQGRMTQDVQRPLDTVDLNDQTGDRQHGQFERAADRRTADEPSSTRHRRRCARGEQGVQHSDATPVLVHAGEVDTGMSLWGNRPLSSTLIFPSTNVRTWDWRSLSLP